MRRLSASLSLVLLALDEQFSDAPAFDQGDAGFGDIDVNDE